MGSQARLPATRAAACGVPDWAGDRVMVGLVSRDRAELDGDPLFVGPAGAPGWQALDHAAAREHEEGFARFGRRRFWDR